MSFVLKAPFQYGNDRANAAPDWLAEIRGSMRDRYFSTKGHAWIRFHNWGFMRFPPNDITPVGDNEKKELFLKTRAAIISNHHFPGANEQPNSVLYLCKDKNYDISKLTANNRSKVRRGNKRLEFSRVDPLTIAEKGHLSYADTCNRNGILPISEKAYRTKWDRNEPQPASREIFAVFAGDEIAAMGVVWICGKWAEILSTQSANKYLKDYSNHALFFNILSDLLSRDSIESVSYGLSSAQPGSRLDSLHHFKLSVNFEALPVVRTITVNPFLRPAVNKITLKGVRLLERTFPNSRHLLAARGALELVFGDR